MRPAWLLPLLAACNTVAHEGTLDHAGCAIYYRIAGHGAPLYLVHGAAPHGIFLPTAAALADTATLVYWDQRGWGRSRITDTTRAATLAADVADLEALRSSLDHARIDLLALSNGGPVAIEYALRHPGRVRRLILLATYADNDDRIAVAQRLCREVLEDPGRRRAMAAIAARKLPPEERAIEEFLLLPSTQHHRPVARAIVEEWVRNGVLGGPAQPALCSPPERVYHGLDRLRRIAVPVLVITGRHDRVTPLVHARKMAERLPNARLVVLEDSGHLAHIDEPQRFLAVVREFLAD